MSFKEVNVKDLQFNPFVKIDEEWMLITAGTPENHNTMTASWGGLGVLWHKNVATAYIRPQRYTKEFVDAADTFTLSFYGEEQRKALTICGTKSGRDCDKEKEAGLTPAAFGGSTAFAEAKLVLVCKKLYAQNLAPEYFLVDGIDEKCYPQKDYHTMYIAEITQAFEKED